MDAATGGPIANAAVLHGPLRALGIDVTVVSTEQVGPASVRASQRVQPSDLPRGCDEMDLRLYAVKQPRRLAYAPNLGRAIEREIGDYDVVHIHSLWLYPQFAASRAARRAGVPFVVSLEGTFNPWFRSRGRARKALTSTLWQRRMLDAAALIHVTTEDEAWHARDVAPGVPRAVVGNAIDWYAFADQGDAGRFRRRWCSDRQGPIVTYSGRLAPVKGLVLLLEAFRRVRSTVPNATLVVAGPTRDAYRQKLERLATRLGIRDSVIFPGMLRGAERTDALAATDVWVLPSASENFAIAALEAMAAARAVIITPHVNGARQLAAAGAARVIERDREALASEIIALLRSEASRRSLAAAAREHSRSFMPEVIARNVAAMYKAAAETRRAR